MRVSNNLLVALLLIAFIADAGAHHRTRMTPGVRAITPALGLAAATLACVFALLLTKIIWPRWTAHGPIFLGITLVALVVSIWLWRDRLGFARKQVK